ncbi:MAG: 3-hydroxyacyl-ACP dehydratase FabZ family protein [Verrucomicrobiota bacterium]
MPFADPLSHGLPHREPFIFIDSVRETVPAGKALCDKTFSGEEPFFRGHFPGDPLVPGVILTEALAQTAGIAAGRGSGGKSYRLSAIKLMKFLRPVRPGDGIRLEAEKIAAVGNLLQFQVRASVLGETAAEGVIVLNEV